jgi:hypothetical protein
MKNLKHCVQNLSYLLNKMSESMSMEGGKKRSAWMTHVKKTMRANKGKPLSAVLKMAKKTYKKTMRGGGVAETAAPLSGGRKSRKSRKSKKNGFKLY